MSVHALRGEEKEVKHRERRETQRMLSLCVTPCSLWLKAKKRPIYTGLFFIDFLILRNRRRLSFLQELRGRQAF